MPRFHELAALAGAEIGGETLRKIVLPGGALAGLLGRLPSAVGVAWLIPGGERTDQRNHGIGYLRCGPQEFLRVGM